MASGTSAEEPPSIFSLPIAGPLVIGHRGAPGYAAEHTARSYRLALSMGVDMIEPDLVPTRDGYLLCRHESELSRSTDISATLTHRASRTIKLIEGKPVTGWFSEDLALADLADVRARERLPRIRPHNSTQHPDDHLLTLDDTIEMVATHNRATGSNVGLCLELKDAPRFASIGLPPDQLLQDSLRRNKPHLAFVPIHVEADDESVLSRIIKSTGLPALQLVRSFAHLRSLGGTERVSEYAAGIAVRKDLVVRRSRAGAQRRATHIVESAHRANLKVFAWTLRNENRYMPTDFRTDDPRGMGRASLEYDELFDAGVDAVFSDHPDTAVTARNKWVARAGRIAQKETAL